MLQVWIVYIPPKNEEIVKKVHKIILEELIKNKKNTFHIVMGDFNTTLNRELDTSSKRKRTQDTNSKIIRWLKNTDHIETFHFCNPDTIKFSWSNSRTATRIDYIWCCQDLEPFIARSDIESAETITDSDHSIVWFQIDSSDLFEKKQGKTQKKSR